MSCSQKRSYYPGYEQYSPGLSRHGIHGNIYGDGIKPVYQAYEGYHDNGRVVLKTNPGSCEKYVGTVEHMGAFSLQAAVRPSGDCGCKYRRKPIPGVN